MRILFYLPVVTPWWFTEIITPMIRSISRDAEVFVLVPPRWRNTGIGGAELAGCADLGHVNWLILDGEDHIKLRAADGDHPDLVALVEDIAPDYTICRSADLETPKRFPGVVRCLMEAHIPPFLSGARAVQFAETLYDHGLMPPLDARQRARLDTLFGPVWEKARAEAADWDRSRFLRAAGLPEDRKLIALPLEYEHKEAFFNQHNLIGDNVAMIDHVVSRMGEDMVLAVTNHPLNERHADNRALYAAIAAHGDRVRLVKAVEGQPGPTQQLARHCHGMAVGNSKCFGDALFSGTPILRLTRFRSGDWMNVHSEVEPFADAIRAGMARGASEADAQLWFACHFLNDSFDGADPSLTAAEIADRMTNPVGEARWDKALAHWTTVLPRLAA